jgi:hypothetical protein
MDQPDTPDTPNTPRTPEQPHKPDQAYKPDWYWPAIIGCFLCFMLLGTVSAGTSWLLAAPVLLGGIRTSLIIFVCRKKSFSIPSRIQSTIVSFVLVLVFQLVGIATYAVLCISRVTNFPMNPSVSPGWLWFSVLCGVGTFMSLYAASIRIGIAHNAPAKPPFNQSPTEVNNSSDAQ